MNGKTYLILNRRRNLCFPTFFHGPNYFLSLIMKMNSWFVQNRTRITIWETVCVVLSKHLERKSLLQRTKFVLLNVNTVVVVLLNMEVIRRCLRN